MEHIAESDALKAAAKSRKPLTEKQFSTLIGKIDAAVCVTDLAGDRIVFANRNFLDSFANGGDPGRLATFEAGFTVAPGSHFMLDQLVEAARNDGAALEEEFYLAAKQQWYLVRARAIEWDGHGLVRLHTYCNITSRAESERFLQVQQEKLLLTSKLMSVGEMASTLAHELNQPLGAIINYVSGSLRRLSQGKASAADLVEPLQSAKLQAEHASRVISRVREFVRTREPRREPHPMRPVIEGVLNLLELEATKQRVRIDINVPASLPPFLGDRVMVEQVTLNLVKNAIEAMRDTPAARRAIRISAQLNADQQIEVAVRDRGTGLSPKTGEQLFSPFFSTKPDGMGIGLNICRSIIEYHGGRLFYSNNEDGGCTFSFTLPAEEAQ